MARKLVAMLLVTLLGASPAFAAEKAKDTKPHRSHKTLYMAIGIGAGALAGWAIGGHVNSDPSADDLTNVLWGISIGAAGGGVAGWLIARGEDKRTAWSPAHEVEVACARGRASLGALATLRAGSPALAPDTQTLNQAGTALAR